MALSDVGDGDKKEKSHEKREKLPTKVIIRRLPPGMDQETFFNQVDPIPSHDYFYMVRGDASLGENAFARAYINFTNPTDIYDFKEKFDNYVFLDKNGHEYPAVVEFASFQKIPKRRAKVKVDSRIGSIENDTYYKDFVEMINAPPINNDEKPEYSYQLPNENKNNALTPLLEFVKHKRAEKMRIREERREERKRKEQERKKFREEDRKNRRFDEKSPIKVAKSKNIAKEPKVIEEKADFEASEKASTSKAEEKPEKVEAGEKQYFGKNREKKFEKRETKTKYPPKKEYEKREYKNRDYKERDFRPKPQFDDHSKSKPEEAKNFPKKVKKYSERREERKIEAQKAELKKLEQQAAGSSKEPESPVKEKVEIEPKEEKVDKKETNKAELKNSPREKGEKYSRSDRDSKNRIRNKDRPTIAIYRPGMLAKTKKPQSEGESENSKDANKSE